MTDDEALPDPLAAASVLPKGSLLVIRSRQAERRARLFRETTPLAKRRGLLRLIADDPELALRCGADGIHLPEAHAADAFHWRSRRSDWIITVAAHALESFRRTRGHDAALLSPIFPTASHPERSPLTPLRAVAVARLALGAVYALGGVDAGNVGRIAQHRFAGVAAIRGLR
jgi:thiamine-phosphate pyrophosphorylase